MTLREPAWWYGDGDRLAARILTPISHWYGHAVERRFRNAVPYQSRLPVICIGNFTAGGTGKTPFTQLMVRLLQDRGARPAILSRGYGGSSKGPHWVDGEHDHATLVGDEPLLLAAHAPVMVARDRAVGARAIESDDRAFSHIVMDDGLQNPSLRKVLSFAVVDGTRGLGNGLVIPAGPLRAALPFQMAQVDAIVVNNGFAGSPAAPPSTITTYLSRAFTGSVLCASIAPGIDPTMFAGEPIVAFAGIGVPERFFDMLTKLGCKIVEAVAFADHHTFNERDAWRLLEAARIHQARLVTTEKDFARLSGTEGACADLRQRTAPVPIRMQLAERDRLRLEALVSAHSPRHP